MEGREEGRVHLATGTVLQRSEDGLKDGALKELKESRSARM